MTQTMQAAPPAALETRDASLVGVNYPNRTIEVVVMPYEEMAVVPFQGRAIREVVSRGAFDGIEQRPGRVKVNRDHDTRMSCGHAVRFHPSRAEGLVAEMHISKTPLGDETLTLADDGVLDASAGFRVMHEKPDAEEWPERDLRRLNKIWLGHVALTPDPAYEGAKVLDVRADGNHWVSASDAAQGLTAPHSGIERPNLAHALALRRKDEYDQLSR